MSAGFGRHNGILIGTIAAHLKIARLRRAREGDDNRKSDNQIQFAVHARLAVLLINPATKALFPVTPLAHRQSDRIAWHQGQADSTIAACAAAGAQRYQSYRRAGAAPRSGGPKDAAFSASRRATPSSRAQNTLDRRRSDGRYDPCAREADGCGRSPA